MPGRNHIPIGHNLFVSEENSKNVASLHDKCCTYWTYRHRMKRLSKVFRIFAGVINLLQD